jgi:DNA-binding NarL/FixJ family response regulator
MVEARRTAILAAYAPHVERFDKIASRSHHPAHLAGENAAPPAEIDDLSERQLEVLSVVADGLSNQEICVRLDVTLETVKSHVLHILRRLNARTRAHAVNIGHQRDLLA